MQKTQGGAFVIPDLFLSICVSQRRSDSDSVTLLHADRAQWGFTRGVRDKPRLGKCWTLSLSSRLPVSPELGERWPCPRSLTLCPWWLWVLAWGGALGSGPGLAQEGAC